MAGCPSSPISTWPAWTIRPVESGTHLCFSHSTSNHAAFGPTTRARRARCQNSKPRPRRSVAATAHSPQPTAHSPQPTAHSPQPEQQQTIAKRNTPREEFPARAQDHPAARPAPASALPDRPRFCRPLKSALSGLLTIAPCRTKQLPVPGVLRAFCVRRDFCVRLPDASPQAKSHKKAGLPRESGFNHACCCG
jgi:hypothetical protein